MQTFLESLEEVLSATQRAKRKQVMKRSAKKRARSAERNKKKRASPEKLKLKAHKLAVTKVKDKLAGDVKYTDLPFSQRGVVDKKAEKKKGLIAKLSKKFIKIVKKKENERLKKMRGGDDADV